MTGGILTLGPAEVARFAAASHDHNPLHGSAEYAHTTPFGEPVVYGVLGALAALGRLPAGDGMRVRQLKLAFKAPILVGQACSVVDASRPRDAERSRARVELRDGSRTLTAVTVQLTPGAPRAAPANGPGERPRDQPARVLHPVEGATHSGTWSPGWDAIAALIEALGLHRLGPADVAAAAFASWLVGMELPGEPALFASATIELAEGRAQVPAGPLPWSATVDRWDERFNLVVLSASLGDPADPIAHLTIQAFVRQPATVAPGGPELPLGDALAGRHALVVGASRGLGAAIAVALARQGATVTGTFRRASEQAAALQAEVLADLEGRPGSLTLVQADALDAGSMPVVVDAAAPHGTLDLLVCNAAPPLHALALDPITLDRMEEHLAAAFRMVAGPLACALPALRAGRGTVVGISSVAVDSPPPEWAHYVAAKTAVEGLLHTAAAAEPQVGFLVLRPPQLLTDYTLNPQLHGALPPRVVALALLHALDGDVAPGTVHRVEVP